LAIGALAGIAIVLGCIRALKYSGIAVPADAVLYRPYARQPFRFGAMVARTDGDPALLAMVGLYAVIAYSTAQRTSEIGVRMAIGAQRADVLRLVLVEGARLAAAGIIVGAAGACWATQLLSAFLYQVTATDPAAFAGSAIVFLAVALLASYLPARRAAHVDPMIALRTE
jgi:hypothetical protein